MRVLAAPAALVLSLAVASCSGRTPQADPPASPRAQPLAEDGTLGRAVTSLPDRAKVQVDLATARAAVRAWHAEHASWPGTVDELRLEGLSYPDDLAYDPSTGAVTSRTYPGY